VEGNTIVVRSPFELPVLQLDMEDIITLKHLKLSFLMFQVLYSFPQEVQFKQKVSSFLA